MNRNAKLYRLVLAALLCAVGILIPMVSPLKVVIPPVASYTLGSHVAIFIAMFLSPATAVAVSLITTLGFFLGGFPLPIVLRALTHVVFALVGSLWLKKRPDLLYHTKESILFCLVIALIHGACEVLVLLPLYFGGSLSAAAYESGFFLYLVVMIGVGSVIHSSADYVISLLVWRPLRQLDGISAAATAH
ncbi:Niacin transporter NiaX [bioreactor metagenome]|uniref:Niacin transporter NiaX n=1 Tax=bioreactor metagenome TaxID=1076179 RepID=A0A645BKV8_9ZZZZ